MSSLFAFSTHVQFDAAAGQRNRERLAESLAHRSSTPMQYLVDPHGIIGFGADAATSLVGLSGGGGVCQCGDVSLGIAGYVTRLDTSYHAYPLASKPAEPGKPRLDAPSQQASPRKLAQLATMGSVGHSADGPTANGLTADIRDSSRADYQRDAQPSRSPSQERPGAAFAQRLIAEYQRLGIAFVENLRGAFVLILRDGDHWYLARDASGARTLYYTVVQGQLVVSIEPKSFRAFPGFSAQLRRSALAEYLTYSFIPGAQTMLEGVYEVPPGCIVHWSPGSEAKTRRYYEFERFAYDGNVSPPAGDRPFSDAEWIAHFAAEFSQSVRERLPHDEEPVGLFLSGGIDSSIVAAELAEQRAGQVQSWAIHFGRQYPNELEFARAVAQRCGIKYEEVEIRPKDFLPRMRQAIWHLDEPIGDPITIPNFELASHASRSARIIFNGEGGDPCFGGPKNLPMLMHHWYGGIERDEFFRERAYLASYRRGYEELSRLLTPDYGASTDDERAMYATLTPFFQTTQPSRMLEKLTAINIRLKGGHLILPKVERMLAASQCVPVSPLFSESMLRLSMELPSHLKLARGIEKVALKEVYRNRLPEEVIKRPKSGMRVPVHFWFQNELRSYARKILSRRELKRAGIWNPDRVRQLLNYDTEEGPGRYGLRLWMLVTFEIWRRMTIEGETL